MIKIPENTKKPESKLYQFLISTILGECKIEKVQLEVD